ncbi:unnamed protein product, partial [Linum tenue]
NIKSSATSQLFNNSLLDFRRPFFLLLPVSPFVPSTSVQSLSPPKALSLAIHYAFVFVPRDRNSRIIMAKSSFKLEHPLERRQAEASRIREKYPDRIPVGVIFSLCLFCFLALSLCNCLFAYKRLSGSRSLSKRLKGVMSPTLIRRSTLSQQI